MFHGQLWGCQRFEQHIKEIVLVRLDGAHEVDNGEIDRNVLTV